MKAILIAVILTVAGCHKKENAGGTPKCIEDRIQEFSQASTCNDPVVKKYKFQGNVVFAFEPGTCGADMTTEIVDSGCKTLGYLGGFAGNTKINGEDFLKAKFLEITWKK